MQSKPIIETHDGIVVVRDDLYPGGTKARFLPLLFKGCDELVYGSPCEGGAQVSIATVARKLHKRATIFCARRERRHPRYDQVKKLGAAIFEVAPGYLNVVEARAATYAQKHDAKLLEFGLAAPQAITAFSEAARLLKLKPREVWCAGGSGVLARSLAAAWPHAQVNVVQAGKALSRMTLGPTIKVWPYKHDILSRPSKAVAPFPSDAHYDLKAWEVCVSNHGSGLIVFWNVLGPPVA